MSEIVRQFTGKWITDDAFCNLEPVNVFHRQLEKKEIPSKAPHNVHMLFRRKFAAAAGQKTEIFISADDYYKLYLNGKFVCQGPAPGYPFHYYYNKVDITDFVQDGENLIAVHTYYQGLINRVWVSGDDRQGLILDVEQNGKVILASDETFVCCRHSGYESVGKTGYDTQFLERYVSCNAQEGFELPGFDDSRWEKAKLCRMTDHELFEQPSKMLVFEEISPVSAEWDDSGVTLDFGKIYVGYLQAKAAVDFAAEMSAEELAAEEMSAAAEHRPNRACVELLFGQELNDDGSVRWQLRCNCNYREEWQLCSKKTQNGGEKQLQSSENVLRQFDYKSFRYVRMNFDRSVQLKEISLLARHYPFALCQEAQQKEVSFVDKELRAIWELCINTLRYGVQEVIQDCMEREKGNYLGDGCYTALTYYALTKDASVLKKLMDDSMRSSFINGGLMTCAACSFMQEIAEYPLMAYHMMWRYYEMSGDLAYLQKHYEGLKAVLDFYRESYALENGLLCNLDKWCVVEWPAPYRDGYSADITEGQVCTDLHSVINAHYIGALQYMNRIAEAMGETPYCDVNMLKKAYFDTFFDPKTNLFCDKAGDSHISLISNVFPLMYAIWPEGRENETQAAILRLIEERGFTRIMLFGAYPVLEGLRRMGRKDLIRKYLLDDGAWKRMLREGATTTFEGWGKDTKWNTSLFHLTLSYGALFLMEL